MRGKPENRLKYLKLKKRENRLKPHEREELAKLLREKEAKFSPEEPAKPESPSGEPPKEAPKEEPPITPIEGGLPPIDLGGGPASTSSVPPDGGPKGSAPPPPPSGGTPSPPPLGSGPHGQMAEQLYMGVMLKWGEDLRARGFSPVPDQIAMVGAKAAAVLADHFLPKDVDPVVVASVEAAGPVVWNAYQEWKHSQATKKRGGFAAEPVIDMRPPAQTHPAPKTNGVNEDEKPKEQPNAGALSTLKGFGFAS